ncbi:MAG TPA: LysR family transcriptional regulator [Myxococcota bacterium]
MNARGLSWDDLRHVVVVARAGSLLQAAAKLGVDHTTVGRRVAAAEAALGVTLFVRSAAGLQLTVEGEQLLAPLQQVEEAIDAVARQAGAGSIDVAGPIKVTAPESFGIAWLAPRLARFATTHPGVRVQLEPGGTVLDLGKGEAEIAVRAVRATKADHLVSRRGATLRTGLYATRAFLARHPVHRPADLARCPLLIGADDEADTRWLLKLAGPSANVALSCVVALALLAACKADAGVAVLPRWLGDDDDDLVYLPMPDEPAQTLWLTVHRDLRRTPRVRAVLDFLIEELRRAA